MHKTQVSKIRTASLKEVLRLCLPYKAALTIGLLGLTVGSGVNLLFPEIIRRYLATNSSIELNNNLGGVVVSLVGLFLLQGISFFVRSYFFNRVGLNVVSEVRERFFSALLSQDISFFDRHRVGEIVSQLSSDVVLVQDLVAIRISVLMRYSVQVILGTTLMAWMSWRLTLVLVASVGVMVAVSFLFITRLKRASRQYQEALATLTSFAADCFTNVRLLRAFVATKWATAEFSRYNSGERNSVLECGYARGIVSASFTSGASALLNILLLGVFWFGITLVMQGSMLLSDFTAFALYGAIVAISFSFLITSYADVAQSMGGLERVLDLIHARAGEGRYTQPPVPSSTQSSLEDADKAVKIEQLRFSYENSSADDVLAVDQLSIQAGKTVAVVGPSGCGKTTLVGLLLGLYRPKSGTVHLFGRPINDFLPEELSSLVAWAPQEGSLFGLSILENIRLGAKDVSAEIVIAKATEWPFLKFVEQLPAGIETVIGEHGLQLSGGQRQRIALARAILRRPKLLILDEATSGLDSTTEMEVLQSIRKELPGTAVLVISHRLATVKAADTIYVMEGGKIVQRGNHDSLRVTSGLYQRYIEQQTLQ